ncbi:MAG: carboxyl transferase domain-containing protein [Eubacteriales bacterium]|nr:carboxyl transferase domain-containing protein [Eubacteriales bacterium]
MKELFNKRKKQLRVLRGMTRLKPEAEPREIAYELFQHCPACGEPIAFLQLSQNHFCCPLCEHHLRLPAKERLELCLDPGYELIDSPVEFSDPLNFPGYREKWERAQKLSGCSEAISFASGEINGEPCIFGAMESRFLMGSMGRIVGDRILAAIAAAKDAKLPLIIAAVSGGARMQEGIISLLQMRRTAAALSDFQRAGGLYIALLCDPCTGGVTASFASLGNVTLAEAGALIGFAGPRVIRETIQCELPAGFQSAEFAREHGFVDRIVKRSELKSELQRILALHRRPEAFAEAQQLIQASKSVENSLAQSSNSSPFERVLKARAQDRIKPAEIVRRFCTDIVEFSGDRLYGDDLAIRGGIARLAGLPITYIYTEKGCDLKSQIAANFGMPEPEGYRKARRLMAEAERCCRPILSIVDTPGAYPGIGAEERGQGEAIAQNLKFMAELKVPLLTVISGEAGSGGALALACSDRLYMLENSVYTLLSPEGFAVILWKDRERAPEAAELMRLTAEDMLEFDICDKLFPDDLTGLKEQLTADLLNYYQGGLPCRN